MKISVDGKDLFTLTETQKKVMQNDIATEVFQADMERRLKWVLAHKYEQCFSRLKKDWDKKLADNGVASVPTHADEYAELVFSQPNYKNRSQRDAEQPS